MVVCDGCGSTEVEEKSWTRPNDDDEYVDSCDEEEGYCRDCGGNHSLIDKDEWDSDNRCGECDKINNTDNNKNFDCGCSICEECDENITAGECVCKTCDNCDVVEHDCCCDKCEDCDEVESKCGCVKDEEEPPMPVITQSSTASGDVNTYVDGVLDPTIVAGPGIMEQVKDATQKVKDAQAQIRANAMVTWKCLDCKHKFEALSTMTMCESCLSDNIIQHGNNNS